MHMQHIRDCTPAPPGLGTCHANAQDSLGIHHLKTVLFLVKDTGGNTLARIRNGCIVHPEATSWGCECHGLTHFKCPLVAEMSHRKQPVLESPWVLPLAGLELGSR